MIDISNLNTTRIHAALVMLCWEVLAGILILSGESFGLIIAFVAFVVWGIHALIVAKCIKEDAKKEAETAQEIRD